MKKKLVLAFASTLICLASRSEAQYLMGGMGKDSTLPKIEFGVKVGGNLQTVTGDTWDNSYKPGIAGGMYIGMQKKKIGGRLEILAHAARYTSRAVTDSSGTSYVVTDSAGNRGDFRLVYLDIPLLFEYRVFHNVWLQLGPQYSVVMSVNSLTAYGGDPKVIFKQGEVSGIIGAEARFPINISAGIRYVYGFTDMNNNILGTTDSWRNQTFQVYVAYRIK